MMKRSIVAAVLATFVLLIAIQCLSEHPDAAWDFTKGRDSALINWPNNEKGDTWNVRPAWYFRSLQIQLPERPLLKAVRPMDVFVDRRGKNVISIQINEDPVTQEQALNRLRSLAKEWNWRWDESMYARWVEGTKKNNLTDISAGDKWPGRENLKTPYVGATIRHAIATEGRPWFIQLFVQWPEAL